MKIWVRSQLENRLVLADHFCTTITGVVLGFQGPEDECGVVLGKYFDECRAVDVLKEISEKIKMQVVVYFMPEE